MSITYIAGFDSPTAKNASLNPIKVNGQETAVITFYDSEYLNATTLGADGDYIVENGADGVDPDTTVEVTFLGVTQYYEFSLTAVGVFPGQPDSANKVPDILEGKRVFIIRIENFDDDGVASTPGVPMQFYFTPDYQVGTAESLVIGDVANSAIDIGITNNNPTPLCFGAGTRLKTVRGWCAVDDLRPGDLVLDTDGQTVPVMWLSSMLHQWPGSDDRHKPVLIKAGTFNGTLPELDMCVSPQHHIVLDHPLCQTMFGASEVLAPAKGLLGLPGVRVMQGKKSVEYFHVLLERHSVIIAEGLPTESFNPGPTAVRMLTPAQRASLLAVVPALRTDPENGYGPTARKKITRREAERLVAAILTDRKAKAVAAE